MLIVHHVPTRIKFSLFTGSRNPISWRSANSLIPVKTVRPDCKRCCNNWSCQKDNLKRSASALPLLCGCPWNLAANGSGIMMKESNEESCQFLCISKKHTDPNQTNPELACLVVHFSGLYRYSFCPHTVVFPFAAFSILLYCHFHNHSQSSRPCDPFHPLQICQN